MRKLIILIAAINSIFCYDSRVAEYRCSRPNGKSGDIH